MTSANWNTKTFKMDQEIQLVDPFFFFYQIWFDRSIFFLLLLLSGGAIYRRWIWVIARFVHFSNCLTRKNNKIKWFIHVSPNKNRIPTPSWNLALFSFFSEIINKKNYYMFRDSAFCVQTSATLYGWPLTSDSARCCASCGSSWSIIRPCSRLNS